MDNDQNVFKVVVLVMIVVSVVGIAMGLSLTAQLVAKAPQTEMVTTRASSLLDCRSECVTTCKDIGKTFEHGKFHDQNRLCDCFCV